LLVKTVCLASHRQAAAITNANKPAPALAGVLEILAQMPDPTRRNKRPKAKLKRRKKFFI